MRAARIHGWNAAPVIDDLAEPSRRPGETLVAIADSLRKLEGMGINNVGKFEL